MTTPENPRTRIPPHKAARQERLEAQLRANLKRRKEAARARATPDETREPLDPAES